MTDHSHTVVENIIQAIRSAIQRGDFAPGQRLVVSELKTRFDTSAGPVREAIRLLAGEGLIKLIPHRGAVVRKFSERDVLDYFQVREGIEGVAARLAANNVEHSDYKARLSSYLADLRKATDEQGADLPTVRQAFHALLYEMSGNPRLTELASQLAHPTFAIRYWQLFPDRAATSLREHEKIVEAVLRGNGTDAENLMRKHLRNTAAAIHDALEADSDFSEVFFGGAPHTPSPPSKQ